MKEMDKWSEVHSLRNVFLKNPYFSKQSSHFKLELNSSLRQIIVAFLDCIPFDENFSTFPFDIIKKILYLNFSRWSGRVYGRRFPEANPLPPHLQRLRASGPQEFPWPCGFSSYMSSGFARIRHSGESYPSTLCAWSCRSIRRPPLVCRLWWSWLTKVKRVEVI